MKARTMRPEEFMKISKEENVAIFKQLCELDKRFAEAFNPNEETYSQIEKAFKKGDLAALNATKADAVTVYTYSVRAEREDMYFFMRDISVDGLTASLSCIGFQFGDLFDTEPEDPFAESTKAIFF